MGKLFGIRLRVDWSILFIALLVTVSLASGLFRAWHPEWTGLLRWVTAVGAAILLFASILAHELSHALVAKGYGIPVRSITLFIFGGMANIEHEPDSPKKEALMAIVGPVTSISLGILFLFLASVSVVPGSVPTEDPIAVMQSLSPIATLFAWLGPVNLILGVFNMVPGFPLDGGRVLRAVLWKITGNLRTATRWASGSGQAFAWLLIALGISMAFGARVPFFGTGLISGLWLAFIGLFLNTAAAMAYQQLVAKETLEDVPLSRLLTREPPPFVPPSTSLDRFIDEFAMSSDWHAFPTHTPHGGMALIHLPDVRNVPKAERTQTLVGEIAVPLQELPSINLNSTAYDALNAFGQHRLDWLPVVDEAGTFVAVVRRQDVARWLELQLEDSRGLSSFRHHPPQQSSSS